MIRPGELLRTMKCVEENANIEIAQHYLIYLYLSSNFLFYIISRQIEKFHISSIVGWFGVVYLAFMFQKPRFHVGSRCEVEAEGKYVTRS